jgi:hypothetical protein
MNDTVMQEQDLPHHQKQLVGWAEVDESAKLAFSVWMGQPELIWAKRQWDALARFELTTYQDEFDRYAVLFRLLVLGGIYRDFCDAAWDEYSEPNYADWAEPLGLDPFTIGQLYARLPDWEADEEITKDEALEALVENERAAVVAALMRSFGSVSGLYASFWTSRDARGEDGEDAPPDGEHDETYDPEDSQLSAYLWVDQGCCRCR